MSNEMKPANSTGHDDFEHRDIDVAAVVYFLIGLAVAIVLSYFLVDGVYKFLSHHFEAEQTPVSPLVAHPQADTRRIPEQYGADYEKYLKESFPAPQLEVNERTELNDERLREEDTLSTYGWVDQKAGVVRIPIDRAMDLVAQHGLPVRTQGAAGEASAQSAQVEKMKGRKK